MIGNTAFWNMVYHNVKKEKAQLDNQSTAHTNGRCTPTRPQCIAPVQNAKRMHDVYLHQPTTRRTPCDKHTLIQYRASWSFSRAGYLGEESLFVLLSLQKCILQNIAQRKHTLKLPLIIQHNESMHAGTPNRVVNGSESILYGARVYAWEILRLC